MFSDSFKIFWYNLIYTYVHKCICFQKCGLHTFFPILIGPLLPTFPVPVVTVLAHVPTAQKAIYFSSEHQYYLSQSSIHSFGKKTRLQGTALTLPPTMGIILKLSPVSDEPEKGVGNKKKGLREKKPGDLFPEWMSLGLIGLFVGSALTAELLWLSHYIWTQGSFPLGRQVDSMWFL